MHTLVRKKAEAWVRAWYEHEVGPNKYSPGTFTAHRDAGIDLMSVMFGSTDIYTVYKDIVDHRDRAVIKEPFSEGELLYDTLEPAPKKHRFKKVRKRK